MTAIVAFIVVILVCVGFHEFGHFVFGKLLGIRVDEFSIGFGPRLISKQRGETRYAIRALPLGGYVRMAGMLGLPGEADAGKRNFYRASIPKRLLVMSAGILANVLLALICFTIVLVTPTASQVSNSSPAYAAGLRDGSSIVSIDNQPIDHSSAEAVGKFVAHAVDAGKGKAMSVAYRDASGALHHTTIQPELIVYNTSPDNPTCDHSRLPQWWSTITAINGHPVGLGTPASLLGAKHVTVSGIGQDPPCGPTQFTNIPFPGLSGTVDSAWKIGVGLDYAGEPVLPAIRDAAVEVATFPQQTYERVREVVTTSGSGGVFGPNGFQGPVGIAQDAGTQVAQGPQAVIWYIGFISVNLALLNVLPIPFLDGGKILLLGIEAARRRRLAPAREAAIYAVGLAMVLMFFVYVTVADLRNHH